MVCIYCQSKTEIINSRHLAKRNATWRRRRCLKCGALLTTNEEADYSRLWVVTGSKQGKLNPFQRDMLFLSIYDSLRHRKAALNDANALTTTIMSKLAKSCSDGQISKQKIIDISLDCLKHFDKTASVYYKAYFGTMSS